MQRLYTLTFARWIILFSTLSSCEPAAERDKPENVKAPLLNYFEAIQKNDRDAMRENTTADFVIFENGKVWSNDTLWHIMDLNPDMRFEYKPTGFKVFVDHESSQISYFNHADVFLKDSLVGQYDWLENVTLRKDDGKWKLNFLQSSPRR